MLIYVQTQERGQQSHYKIWLSVNKFSVKKVWQQYASLHRAVVTAAPQMHVSSSVDVSYAALREPRQAAHIIPD